MCTLKLVSLINHEWPPIGSTSKNIASRVRRGFTPHSFTSEAATLELPLIGNGNKLNASLAAATECFLGQDLGGLLSTLLRGACSTEMAGRRV